MKGLAVEDIGIGKRVKASGLGLLFANGRHLLRTHMYTEFRATLDGWTRILSASMNYNAATVVRHLAIHILMSPFVAVLALYMFAPAAQRLFPVAWLVLPLIFAVELLVVPPCFCSQLGIPKKYCVLMCLGNLFLIWTFAVMIKKILRGRSPMEGDDLRDSPLPAKGVGPCNRFMRVQFCRRILQRQVFMNGKRYLEGVPRSLGTLSP